MQPWQWLYNVLSDEPAVLLIVVASTGSSPGKVGAKMAVSAHASTGTIGGGAFETELLNTARAMLAAGFDEPVLYRKQHHASPGGHASGMICGGAQTVLVYPCRRRELPVFEQLAACCRLRTPRRLKISRQGLQVSGSGGNSFAARFTDGDDWAYRENVGQRKTAYIVGGGHVSLALSKVLDWLDFDCVVIDEREGLETMQQNDVAWKKIVAPYDEIGQIIPDGPEHFILIMTHSHQRDAWVLARLAGKNVPYIGLMGSRKKIAAIKQALAGQLPEAALQRLHAPIGLAIGSHTPAEIAVSIAAELIQVINSG